MPAGKEEVPGGRRWPPCWSRPVLCEPSSEFAHCRGRHRRTALSDLLQLEGGAGQQGPAVSVLDQSTAGTKLRQAHLSQRVGELFVDNEAPPTDVTSTYFEGEAIDGKPSAIRAITAPTANRCADRLGGHLRWLPAGLRGVPGNTHDATTVRIVVTMEARLGRWARCGSWTGAWRAPEQPRPGRETRRRYILGTPKSDQKVGAGVGREETHRARSVKTHRGETVRGP